MPHGSVGKRGKESQGSKCDAGLSLVKHPAGIVVDLDRGENVLRIKNSFHTYAVITILFWSLAYVYTRMALNHISSFSLGVLRYVVASLALLALAILLKIKPPLRKDIPWFVLAGLCGFGLYVIIFNIGTSYVTAATSSLVIATVPIITALLAAGLYREKLQPYQWFAVGIEFAGIVVLTLLRGSMSINIGTIWLLVAALLVSCYNIIQRRLTKQYEALQSTTYSIFAGTLFLLVLLPGAVDEVREAPPVVLWYILFLGIFCSAVAYVSWSKALKLAEKTSSVSNYIFFTPLLTGLLGFVIAKEAVDAPIMIGGIVIILGAILFNKKNILGAKEP